MKTSRFPEEPIVRSLLQAEAGMPAVEVCRKLGVSEQTLSRWKRKFAGVGVAELRRLRQVEEENRKLKQLVADLTLDKHMLQEVIAKKILCRLSMGTPRQNLRRAIVGIERTPPL